MNGTYFRQAHNRHMASSKLPGIWPYLADIEAFTGINFLLHTPDF